VYRTTRGYFDPTDFKEKSSASRPGRYLVLVRRVVHTCIIIINCQPCTVQYFSIASFESPWGERERESRRRKMYIYIPLVGVSTVVIPLLAKIVAG